MYWFNISGSILFLFTLELYLAVILLPLTVSNEVNSPKQNEDLFKQLFKLRRAEQLQAVKKITAIEESKQQKMVKTVTKTIFDVMQKSRTVLVNAGYTPGVSAFPESESVRDALSLVVENTALMGEIILRLPDVAGHVLRSSGDWSTLLAWGLNFVGETQLLDSSTSKLFYLVSQELNFTKRGPDYVNPYRKVKHSETRPKEENESSKRKKIKTRLPRGPRLTVRQEL